MLSDENFINIALELATASKCVSKQVGAVIVKDGRILSTGITGHLQDLQTVVIIGMVSIRMSIMSGVRRMRYMLR